MSGRFGRVLTAMATPFRPDGGLDVDGAQRLAAHLLANGTDTIVVAGTTGESPTLTIAERERLTRAVIEVAGGDRVMVGASTYSTAESIELAEQADKLGAGALILVTPYYNKPPQAGLIAHFSAVAGATELPCMLYDVPSRTNVRIEVDTVLRLAELPNVVAIKDAVGDMAAASRIRKATGGALEQYSGDDKNLLPLLAVGGVGVVSVLAHLVGPAVNALVAAWDAGDSAAALRLHLDHIELFEGMFATTSPILLKAALAELGLPGGPVRPPLVQATDAQRAFVRDLLARHGVTRAGDPVGEPIAAARSARD
jgi:4-hydroxy-tetrahydrodipicolinate synthase